MKRIAIFASGRGTNLENILKKIKQARLRATAVLAFSDNPRARAIRKAKRYGVATAVLEPSSFENRDTYEREVLRILKAHRVDYVILAGFMRILGPVLVRAYKNRILNIHPALLPSFRGREAIHDAFRHGAKVTGVTIHFVDEKVDHGPIILQKAVPVEERDTLGSLERKIHAVEYELYPRAIQLVLSGRAKIRGRRVYLKPVL